jgi:hypothetical protein
MVTFRVTPMDAIRSATSRAAEMLDASNDIDTITPGAATPTSSQSTAIHYAISNPCTRSRS